MAGNRLASWWVVWTMAAIGVLLGAMSTYYNVNMVDSSSVSPPVRDCLPLLLLLYLASWPGWLAEMLLDVMNGPAQWTSLHWVPFLLGQAAGFALLGLFLHLGSLGRRSLARRWHAHPAPTQEDPASRP